MPWGQILASLFRVHVGDRKESGRSLVCEPASIIRCNTDPEPAKPGSTLSSPGFHLPQELCVSLLSPGWPITTRGTLLLTRPVPRLPAASLPSQQSWTKRDNVQMPSPMGPTGVTSTHRPYSLHGPAAPKPDGRLQSSRRDYSHSFQRVLNPWGS